jgi:hypothetical protein
MIQCGNTGSARQATDENGIQRMRFECWVTKATDTHSEYVILLFHSNNGDANVPHYYVTRTLPVFRDMCVCVRVRAVVLFWCFVVVAVAVRRPLTPREGPRLAACENRAALTSMLGPTWEKYVTRSVMRIPRRRLSLQGRRGSGDGWRLWHVMWR